MLLNLLISILSVLLPLIMGNSVGILRKLGKSNTLKKQQLVAPAPPLPLLDSTTDSSKDNKQAEEEIPTSFYVTCDHNPDYYYGLECGDCKIKEFLRYAKYDSETDSYTAWIRYNDKCMSITVYHINRRFYENDGGCGRGCNIYDTQQFPVLIYADRTDNINIYSSVHERMINNIKYANNGSPIHVAILRPSNIADIILYKVIFIILGRRNDNKCFLNSFPIELIYIICRLIYNMIVIPKMIDEKSCGKYTFYVEHQQQCINDLLPMVILEMQNRPLEKVY
jgi:hypothetical protein